MQALFARPLTVFLAAALAIVLIASRAEANVTIKKDPPVVRHRVFDPNDRPKDMPTLHGDEAAVTESAFRCSVSTNFHIANQHHSEGHCTATAKVDGLVVHLELTVTIWVPNDADEKLTAHEEGHRKIAERIYAERAKAVAQLAARKVDGHFLTGEAETCNAAANAGVAVAANKLCSEWLEQTSGVCGEVGKIYDRQTNHGRAPIAEDEAIRIAFRRYERAAQRATTQPATAKATSRPVAGQ